MAELVLLGTGAALSDQNREHTFMIVCGEKESVLIDCGGSPIQRLLKAGVDLESIEHVILTHHHPDHLYGLSVFLMGLWLSGRKKALDIYGLKETLRAAKTMMHALDWEHWRKFGMFPVEFHTLAPKGINLMLVTREFTVSTTTTKHFLPTVASRITSNKSGKTMVYSSDTEVCDSVAEIAWGVDIFLHESTTVTEAKDGHSSAVQAGQQAHRAHAKKLVLVHLSPGNDAKALHAAAKKNFKRQVVVSKDFQRFKF
jgi:ribonuclease BN (tRNA processing enzyme)